MEIGRLFGLPAHHLIVHAVVVLVPLCAFGVAVSSLWPAARWRLAWVLLGLTVVSVALVPFATGSGEVLKEMVKERLPGGRPRAGWSSSSPLSRYSLRLQRLSRWCG
jgi:hypothetical protein